MLVTKSEQVGKFRIITEYDDRGKIRKTVFVDYISVVRFNPENLNERKLAVVELVELGHCNIAVAAKICEFHRNSVFKYLRIKRLLGIEALLADERGPKSPFKYVGPVRSHIKKLLRKYPEWKDQEIADQAARDLNIEISRSAIARIRTEKETLKREKNLPKRDDLLQLAKEADKIEKELKAGQQLMLNFDWDEDLKKKSETFSKQASPQGKTKPEIDLIRRLQVGCRCSAAGGLMHHLFLEEFGVSKLWDHYPHLPGTTYQPGDILSAIFHSVHLGFQSIESLKLVNASEMGVLIGMDRFPEKETIRSHLGLLSKMERSSDLIDDFARTLLQMSFVDPEVFFIDGHFLPYYGMQLIAKGYHTVRRLAMRGNELYVVSDLHGRPLFFMTESNEIDFRPIILQCAGKLNGLGISRPTMVFDRGGYGIHFFKELDASADFVTWAKYVSNKTLDSIPDDDFKVGMVFNKHKYLVAEVEREVSESAQTAAREGRLEPTSIKVRMIIIRNADSGKRMGIFTNNSSKPLWDIAYYMLNRWGDSENSFKELMKRFNLNYHPGYDISELESQPLVDNPDLALVKKAIQILRKEIEELEKGIELMQLRQEKKRDKRRDNKISKLNKSMEEKQEDLKGFQKKLAELPDKVSIVDLLKGRAMSRCDLEKKRLYDLMQFMAYNSRERLVELFRTCYDDSRDIKPVLDMITGKGGYVRLFGETLIVVLDWIENKKHRDAAVRFFRVLNEKCIKMVGRLGVKLFFHLAARPGQLLETGPELAHI